MRDDAVEDEIPATGAADAAEPVEEDLDDEEAPQPRRSPLRLALASALTTAVGAGIALALISTAQAGTAEPATTAAATAAAATAAPAVQQYSAPREYRLKKLKRDRFTAFTADVGADDDGAGSVQMPSGPVAPAGEAQTYAAAQVSGRGWAKREFACLVSLWSKESGWNAHAGRPNGPYGIPQAYPGTKMAAAGGDWMNDHRVQIRWGIGYIAGRWGTPCKAWANSQAHGSY